MNTIIYPISRSQVEAMDCSAVLWDFDVDRLTPLQLQAIAGRICYRLEGYDAHPEDLHLIPDVRRFVRQWHELDRSWLFFSALGADDGLRTLYLALLESVEHVPVGTAGLFRVRFQTGEMVGLLAADLTNADALAVKAGFSEADRCQRARAILGYFGFEGGGR